MKKQVRFLATTAALFALTQISDAATKHWAHGDAAPNEWSQPTRWTDSELPGTTTADTAIFSGTDAAVVTGAVTFTEQVSLIVRSTSGVTPVSLAISADMGAFSTISIFDNGNVDQDTTVTHDAGTVTTTGNVSIGGIAAPAGINGQYFLSGTGVLNVGGALNLGQSGIFSIDGENASASAASLTMTTTAELAFAFDANGVGEISTTGAFTIDSADSLLTLDISAFDGMGTFDLVTFSSKSGAFNPDNITGLGALSGNRTATLGYDANSIFVTIDSSEPSPIQAAYYVDPDFGSDTNPGSLSAPFQSIEKARNTVRTVNNSMTGNIVVYLRGGVYSLTNTLTLDDRDSGSNGYRVIYRNYPHEEPIIDGGKQITGWTAVGGGIYSANAGGMIFNQMFVNNSTAQRARHPEYGSEYNIISNVGATKTIRINATEIEQWTNLNRVQMVIGTSFTSCRLRIGSFVSAGTEATVTPMDPEREAYWGWLAGPLSGSASYFFENHLSFLDTPGEWFLDIDTDTVYYMPRAGEDLASATVVVPQLEQLLSVEDTEDLTLFGITFQNASWLEPMSRGMVQRQASMRVLATQENNGTWDTDQFEVVPVATYFKGIKNVRIERCIFRQMGAGGMGFDTGTMNNSVVGNVFADIAETGIIYDMDNDRTDSGSQLSSLDTFDSNYFFRMGTLYYGGAGMFAFWPDQITITHNEFSQINGFGMNVGWGATYDVTALNAPVVTHNRIHDCAILVKDSGGIHTKSNQQQGAQYSYNWIYNCSKRSWWSIGPDSIRHTYGLYLDDNSQNITAQWNVFMNILDDDIKVKGNGHTFANNDTQDPTVKAESGLRPGYADIKQFWRGGAIGRDLAPNDFYTSAVSDLGVLLDDDFDSLSVGAQPAGYTYSLSGSSSIEVVDVPGTGNHSVRFTDDDASNSSGASMSRSIGEQSGVVACSFRIKAGQTNNSMFFTLTDSAGNKACQVGFSGNGNLRYVYQSGSFTDIVSYTSDTWYTFRIEADISKQAYSVWIDDTLVLGESLFFEPTGPLTTLELANTFATGFFDLDYLDVESDAVASSLVTAMGTPYSWMDQHYDTTGWSSVDYELQDVSDDDHDGVMVWEEFTAGTNPNDSSSVLKVLSLSSEANGLSFSWKTQRDRIYSVQSSPNLQPESWAKVSNSVFTDIPGSGGLQQFTTNMGSGSEFFRILVEE